jgi:hypothetical protein
VFFAVVVSVGMLLASAPAQGGRVRGTPAAIVFTDDDTIYRMLSDAPNGGVDGLFDYINGVEGVTATYDANGVLSVKCGSFRPSEFRRNITLKLMDVGGCVPNEQTSTNLVDNLTVDLTTGTFEAMAVGSWADATLAIDFSAGRETRKFRFDPVNYPGTSDVTVTRTSDTTWTVSAAAGQLAELIGPGARKGDPPVDLGCYSVPFLFEMRPAA